MPTFEAFSPVDLVTLAVVGLGLIVGLIRGAAGELAGLLSVLIAGTIGFSCHRAFGAWLETHDRISGASAYATAFALSIIGAWLILIIPKLVLGKIMKVTFEKGFNRIGGAIAGAIRMTAWALLLFVFMQMIPHSYLNLHFGSKSVLGRGVYRLAPGMIQSSDGLALPEALDEVVEDVGP